MEKKEDAMKMIYSGVMKRDKEEIVHVRFEREVDGKVEFAEGIVPDAMIEKSVGFSLDECKALEFYLTEHAREIFEEAKKINEKEFWLR